MTLTFHVPGVPVSQGSKTAFVRHGRAVLVEGRRGPARAAFAAWRYAITCEAQNAMVRAGAALFVGPVQVALAFTFVKPKRARAHAVYKATRPDVDKCARLALDSLSGVVFADDAQVAALSASKMFAASAGCRVTVASLEGTPPLAGNGAQQ